MNKTVELTSYDVPAGIKNKINTMQTIEEVQAYRNSVKSPNACEPGDIDITIWYACTSVIDAQSLKDNPPDRQDKIDIFELIPFLDEDD